MILSTKKNSITDDFEGDLMCILPKIEKKINISSIYGEFKKQDKYERPVHTKEKDAEDFIKYLELIGIDLKLYQKEMIKLVIQRGAIIDRNSRYFTFIPKRHNYCSGLLLSDLYCGESYPYINSDPKIKFSGISLKPNDNDFIQNCIIHMSIGNFSCFYNKVSFDLSDATLSKLFIKELRFKQKMSIKERIDLDIEAIVFNSIVTHLTSNKNKKNYDNKVTIKSSKIL